jgi:undecaprenyl diphosphate synthase
MAKIPSHVAIIMDGNGRWAETRGHPRAYGHIRGATRVKPVVLKAKAMGVKALTLFTFSTENWSRPPAELSVLWRLLSKFLRKEVEHLNRENIRLRVIGELDRLPEEARAVVQDTIARLSKNTGMQFTLALSYGSRDEICKATQRFAEDCLKGVRKPEQITAELMSDYLWTSVLGEVADVDLVIRTSGEKRLSNFMLWQAAYAEFIFLNDNWPDFTTKHLEDALAEYGMRDRRFGAVAAPSRAAPKPEVLL